MGCRAITSAVFSVTSFLFLAIPRDHQQVKFMALLVCRHRPNRDAFSATPIIVMLPDNGVTEICPIWPRFVVFRPYHRTWTCVLFSRPPWRVSAHCLSPATYSRSIWVSMSTCAFRAAASAASCAAVRATRTAVRAAVHVAHAAVRAASCAAACAAHAAVRAAACAAACAAVRAASCAAACAAHAAVRAAASSSSVASPAIHRRLTAIAWMDLGSGLSIRDKASSAQRQANSWRIGAGINSSRSTAHNLSSAGILRNVNISSASADLPSLRA